MRNIRLSGGLMKAVMVVLNLIFATNLAYAEDTMTWNKTFYMIVISGVGLTGTRDGRIIRFKAGDTVWCPPGIDHWHGATPDSPMTHLVVTGALDGQNVVWKEKVTDEQYNRIQ